MNYKMTLPSHDGRDLQSLEKIMSIYSLDVDCLNNQTLQSLCFRQFINCLPNDDRKKFEEKYYTRWTVTLNADWMDWADYIDKTKVPYGENTEEKSQKVITFRSYRNTVSDELINEISLLHEIQEFFYDEETQKYVYCSKYIDAISHERYYYQCMCDRSNCLFFVMEDGGRCDQTSEDDITCDCKHILHEKLIEILKDSAIIQKV